jgi:hypothetical protein
MIISSSSLFRPGFVADHLDINLVGGTNSMRFIAPWLVKLPWPSFHLIVTYFALVALTVLISAESPLKQTLVPTCSLLGRRSLGRSLWRVINLDMSIFSFALRTDRVSAHDVVVC